MQIAYTKPSITQLEIDYATDAASNGWGEKCYDYILRFEKEFADYLGVEYAIATSSCTGAMTLGLHALGIGSGDEVIIADTNWIATVSPIVHLGATPILVDIKRDTWCIDPAKVLSSVSDKTKAVIVTHLYGNLCDMEELMQIGSDLNIPIIEDSAEALGAICNGKRAGSMGTFSTFSFHGTKTMTTGEGGMFVTNDPSLYETALSLNNHGRVRGEKKQFWAQMFGHKFKISNIQAAIGCAQLSRIDELVGRKKEILSYYKESFARYESIFLNHEQQNCSIGAWMPNVFFSKIEDTSELMNCFIRDGIDARPFFGPSPVFLCLQTIPLM